MNPKPSYQVFVAIPFDGAMKPMYERILESLNWRLKGRFRFVYGNNMGIKPTPHLTMDLFKNQNNDLLDQFKFNIKSSDIIIADLTNNNPNVHVELGIAITLNKNILRVLGRNLVEVASDIRGYETNRYSNEKELSDLIERYLNLFLSIKDLKLSEESGPFYKLEFPQERKIEHTKEGTPPLEPITVRMRDGTLKVEFKFEEVRNEWAWFGVYFRCRAPEYWRTGYQLYIRKNGKLELVELPIFVPELVTPLNEKKYPNLEYNQWHILQFWVDGDKLVACLDSNLEDCLNVKDLSNQSPGNVALGCSDSSVSFKQVETVVRDTINFRHAF